MTTAGWIIMIVSVGSVLGVFLWSLWLVLTTPHEIERVHGFEQNPDDPAETQENGAPPQR